ncbi:NRDE family protein [Emticicia sp. SJ17W-69]|uniref:NRDE family protein n=1 Tax=Emticicia sp. SJ17W-69 TaxID=3421657 RepID=UPI003EB8DDDC
MCVLTYLPTANGFIFTSNRDESVVRASAIPPRKYEIEGHYVFFPKDPVSSGTWIGGDDVFTLCLLNGGLIKHIPSPPYRHSRGKVILDFYKFLNVENFLQNYDFNNIEPFTLVIIDRNNSLTINEIRWTGKDIFYKKHAANNPKIWSSVTLYSPEIIQEREYWFENFLQENPNYTAEDILRFHHFGGKGDIRNDIKMNRENKLKTLSVTQFVVDNENFVVQYQDLQKDKNFVYRVFTECIL